MQWQQEQNDYLKGKQNLHVNMFMNVVYRHFSLQMTDCMTVTGKRMTEW